MKNFEDVLRELEEARSSDDELHRRGGSLAERVASRERLMTIRAELVKIRASLGIDVANVAGLQDSRTRRGTSAAQNGATAGPLA